MSLLQERPEQEPRKAVTNYVKQLRELSPDALQVKIQMQKNRFGIQSNSLALSYVFLEAGTQTLREISAKYKDNPHPNNKTLMNKITLTAKHVANAEKAETARNDSTSIQEGYAALAFAMVYVTAHRFVQDGNGHSDRIDFANRFNTAITGSYLQPIDTNNIANTLPADRDAHVEGADEIVPDEHFRTLSRRYMEAGEDVLALLTNDSWDLMPTYVRNFVFRNSTNKLVRKDMVALFQELRGKIIAADPLRRLLADNAEQTTQTPQNPSAPSGRRGQPSNIAKLDWLAELDDIIPEDL